MHRYLCLQYLLHAHKLGGVMPLLKKLQHGEGSSIPWLDRMALIIVAGPVLVTYDLPELDKELQPSETADRNPATAASERLHKAQAELKQEAPAKGVDMNKAGCPRGAVAEREAEEEPEFEFTRNHEHTFVILCALPLCHCHRSMRATDSCCV